MPDDHLHEPELEVAPFTPLHPVFADAPGSVTFRKLRKRLVRETLEAIRAYGMVSAGSRPRWLVCLSGGKDSYTLLSVLLDLQWQGALPVDLIGCNVDQGQPGFPKHILPDYFAKIGVQYRVITQDT
jgi:tRNA 2-thiocytidine biosynthesis protein TtcA